MATDSPIDSVFDAHVKAAKKRPRGSMVVTDEAGTIYVPASDFHRLPEILFDSRPKLRKKRGRKPYSRVQIVEALYLDRKRVKYEKELQSEGLKRVRVKYFFEWLRLDDPTFSLSLATVIKRLAWFDEHRLQIELARYAK